MKGIMGRGRGLISIETNVRDERDCGRGAWLKALWAWPNPQLKSMGGGRKGIMGSGAWPNAPLKGVKGIVGRWACLKAVWAWTNPPLKSMGGGRKGIGGRGSGRGLSKRGRGLRHCGRGLTLH